MASAKSAIAAAAASKAGTFWATKAEPGWVEVAQVTLTLPRLSPAFDGFRVAHLSDIHMDGWMNRARLTSAVEEVNAQNVDLVAITGDFVSGRTLPARDAANDLVAALGNLKARHGAVAVLGNHDHWADAGEVHRILRAAEIRELPNAVWTLSRERETLHIAGADDLWTRKTDLPAILRKLPDAGAALLMIHEPDFADVSAQTNRFDLQISGHSHGGQVCAPFFGPMILPEYGTKYSSGFYQIGSMIQYTNRGLGMIAPRVRFNCRPEITIFTLRSAMAK